MTHLYFNYSIVFSHFLCGELGMRPRPLPLPGLHRLGVQRDQEAEVLGDPVQEVARHPEVVPHLDPLARPHLELPLGGHHLKYTPLKLSGKMHKQDVVALLRPLLT